MAVASPQMLIADLRRWLARMESRSRESAAVLPFDIIEVDAHVPGGGLQLGHLHEVIEGGAASEYAGLATLFAAGVVARLAGPVLWCLRGRDLFAPALARIGLHPDRVIYCETWKDREVLPAMEEGLKCRGLLNHHISSVVQRHPVRHSYATKAALNHLTRDRRGRICKQVCPSECNLARVDEDADVEKSAQLGQSYAGSDVEEIWRVRDRRGADGIAATPGMSPWRLSI
jgi:hypothetical protein